MRTDLHIGGMKTRRLTVRTSAWSGYVVVELDGNAVLKAPDKLFGANYTFWFATDLEDLKRLLIKVRTSSSSIEGVTVYADPTNEQLEALGEGRLIGCAYLNECRTADGGLLKDFREDLAAFVGNGLRFSLSHLMFAVFAYGLAMAASMVIWQRRFQEFAAAFALVWLVSLGLFAASGIGHALRRPEMPVPQHRWVFARRLAWGLAFGLLACAFVVS